MDTAFSFVAALVDRKVGSLEACDWIEMSFLYAESVNEMILIAEPMRGWRMS